MGRHARLVRRRLPGQRQVRCHHVCLIRHRDPARDRHLQPAAPAEAPAGHPGDGVTDESFGAADVENHSGLRRDEPRVDRQRLAATAW